MSEVTDFQGTEHVSQYNDVVRSERCYFCPARHNLQTHHIVPQRKNGGHHQENLVIVCQTCHKKLETLYDKRFYERLGLTDDRGDDRSHHVCFIADCTNAATLHINNVIDNDWVCREHGEPLLESDDRSLIKEVDALVK